MRCSQIGIYTRNTSIRDWRRQGLEPAFRFPLKDIWAPQVGIPVGRQNADNDISALGHTYFFELLPIYSPHGLVQWNNGVFCCTIRI